MRDAEGRALRWTGPGGDTLSGTWDPEGVPELIRYSEGVLARRQCDGRRDHWLISETGGRLIIDRRLERDALGRVSAIEDRGITRLYRDALGALSAVEEMGRGTWSKTPGRIESSDGSLTLYDTSGRPIKARAPAEAMAWGLSGALEYLMDLAGRLVTVAGDAGRARGDLDGLGRPITVDGPAGRVDVHWDWLGRPDAIQGPSGRRRLVFGASRLLSWTESDQTIDVLHEPGWGYVLSGHPAEMIVTDESGHPRAIGRRLEAVAFSPTGAPRQACSLPIGWAGALSLFEGGPLLDAGGAWDPIAGVWIDGGRHSPWARRPPPTGQWPEVDGVSAPWWDPDWWAPTGAWRDPLALMVAMGELDPVLEGEWLSTSGEPPPLGWLPAAAATPDAPLCPPLGALPLDLRGQPLASMAIRSALPPSQPIDSEAILRALVEPVFAEEEPLNFAGATDAKRRPWLPDAALLR